MLSSKSNKSETFYGFSAGTAGDVNDDGYVDLIVGAPEYKTEGDNKRGRAFVYHGTGDTGRYYAIYLPLVLRTSY
ncbi:MAG: integrin alpha [Halopseudomonas sp.]